MYLKGINKELKFALGTAELTIFGYTTEFQIVPEDFLIPYEGLLGTGYFETSHSLLDCGNKFLKDGEKYSAFRNRKTLNLKSNLENKEILLTPQLEDENIKSANLKVSSDPARYSGTKGYFLLIELR